MMYKKCGVLLLMATFHVPLSAQEAGTSAQTPEAAQAFLRSAIRQWARVSTEKLPAHHGVQSVSTQSKDCETVIKYDGGAIVISWQQTGEITTRNLKTSEYPQLLKVERPSASVQIYFNSAEMMRRTFVASNFLKNYCSSGAF